MEAWKRKHVHLMVGLRPTLSLVDKLILKGKISRRLDRNLPSASRGCDLRLIRALPNSENTVKSLQGRYEVNGDACQHIPLADYIP